MFLVASIAVLVLLEFVLDRVCVGSYGGACGFVNSVMAFWRSLTSSCTHGGELTKFPSAI